MGARVKHGTRERVYERDAYCCRYCGKPVVTACFHCNQAKGDADPLAFLMQKVA